MSKKTSKHIYVMITNNFMLKIRVGYYYLS